MTEPGGLHRGAGVLFETIELRCGRPFAVTRHLQRLCEGAVGLGVSAPARSELMEAANAVARAWGVAPGRLRVTLSYPIDAGSGSAAVTMHATELQIRTEPIDVIAVTSAHNEAGATFGLKTSHYVDKVAAMHAAAAEGAGEALFANTRGELCEGATSNVFVVIDATLCTPPLDSGCLPGVTRALLLEALRGAGIQAQERAIHMTELDRADEVLLVSTGRHLQPVRSIDGRSLPRVDSAATRELRALFRRTYAELVDP